MSMMVHNGTGWEPWAEETGGGGGPDLTGLVDRSATELDLSGLGDTGSIGTNAFSYCSSLTSLTLPAGMTGGIGQNAFAYCSSLTSLTFPTGMTGSTIGNSAFYGCSSLTSLTLPEGMWGSIGTNAFQNCYALASLTLPPGLTGSIGVSAFQNCTSLASLTLPAGMTGTLGNSAFNGCSVLTSLDVPAGITSIGTSTSTARVFRNCTALEYIILRRASVVTLGHISSFEGTTCLIYVPADLVDAYKTANNWSTLADRIFAIPAELL